MAKTVDRNAALVIREVKTKKERVAFVRFPNELYRDNPYYVPPFFADELSDMDEKKNPAFSYAKAKYFLAYRGKKIVGRIGAIYSTRANIKWQNTRMRFTQVDFVDDREVSRALFSAVEAFAAEMGCHEVHGPLGFCDLDREGMLVDGFEEKGLFYTYYNAPYYKEHLEALGYIKDVDWIEINVDHAKTEPRTVQMLEKLSARALKRHNLHIVDIRRKSDFRHVILIMTSNAGAQHAHQASIGFNSRVSAGEAMLKQVKRNFKPEFINRLSGTVIFNDMDKKMATLILEKKLRELQSKLTAKGVTMQLSDAAKELMLKKGFTPEYGAREMERTVAAMLKPLLTREILFGKLKAGGTAHIDTDGTTLIIE